MNNRPQGARTLLVQAELAAAQGLTIEALRLQHTALREFHEIEDHQGIASGLEAIASTHIQAGANSGLFLKLISAAAELRRNTGLKLGRARTGVLDALSKKVAEALGDAAARAATESGKRLGVGEAVQLALNGE